MGKNKHLGRRHKSGTGHSKSEKSARLISKTKVTTAASPSPREPRSRKPLVPAFWTPSAREAEAADSAVSLAAQEINRCTDKLMVATNRWEEFMRIGGNTMNRYKLLAAKPGQRSQRWYTIWEDKLVQMEQDEEVLSGIVTQCEIELEAAEKAALRATDERFRVKSALQHAYVACAEKLLCSEGQ